MYITTFGDEIFNAKGAKKLITVLEDAPKKCIIYSPSNAKILIPRHEQKATPQVSTYDVTGVDLVRN